MTVSRMAAPIAHQNPAGGAVVTRGEVDMTN